MLEEQYQGAFDSLEAWAEQYMDDTDQLAALPDHLQRYFDFAAFARDAELGGDILTVENGDGQVHVFNSR